VRLPFGFLLLSLSCAISGSNIASVSRPLAAISDIKLNIPKITAWLISAGKPLLEGGAYK